MHPRFWGTQYLDLVLLHFAVLIVNSKRVKVRLFGLNPLDAQAERRKMRRDRYCVYIDIMTSV